MIALVIASASFAVWIYLLLLHGGFWYARERDDEYEAPNVDASDWPRVVAVIPARNEAVLIGETLRTLLRQDYRGPFSIVVVDDHSSDGTHGVVDALAASCGASDRLCVLAAPDLPAGWTGKLWALAHGIRHVDAMAQPPDYLWLTDADIRHATDSLRWLVARARRDGLVLTSILAKLRCETFVERAFVPAFVFFFQMLYPFAWVNAPRRATAAAAGGSMLVHRATLSDIGGVAAIRSEIIDDCALARRLKQRGPIWLGLSERERSERAYRSYESVRRAIIRSAFAQLRYSPWWLAATFAAMAVVFVAPPFVGLFANGTARIAGIIAWALMAAAFRPTLRFYRASPLWGIALPAIASCYMVLTLDSAIQHMRGRGGEWKGRVQGPAAPQTAPRLGETSSTSNVQRSDH